MLERSQFLSSRRRPAGATVALNAGNRQTNGPAGDLGSCTMKQLGGNTSNDVPQLLKFARQDSTSRSSLIFIYGPSDATKRVVRYL